MTVYLLIFSLTKGAEIAVYHNDSVPKLTEVLPNVNIDYFSHIYNVST